MKDLGRRQLCVRSPSFTTTVRITAVCDVWNKNLQAAARRVADKTGVEPHSFQRFLELLARDDIDAVTIATPNFSHGTILTAALEAGKDVYIEKPMTIDLASANRALDLARAKGRVVQAGTQRRSEGRFIGAAKQYATGLLGHVSRVSAAMYFHERQHAVATIMAAEALRTGRRQQYERATRTITPG